MTKKKMHYLAYAHPRGGYLSKNRIPLKWATYSNKTFPACCEDLDTSLINSLTIQLISSGTKIPLLLQQLLPTRTHQIFMNKCLYTKLHIGTWMSISIRTYDLSLNSSQGRIQTKWGKQHGMVHSINPTFQSYLRTHNVCTIHI